ncbi:MAG: hypothetical protein AAGI12_15565 [Pseudomonadota bacterium]
MGEVLAEFLPAYTYRSLGEAGDEARMMRYVKALARFSIEVIWDAADAWDQGRGVTGKENFNYPPTPAVMSQMCARALNDRSMMQGKVNCLLRAKVEQRSSAQDEEREKVDPARVQAILDKFKRDTAAPVRKPLDPLQSDYAKRMQMVADETAAKRQVHADEKAREGMHDRSHEDLR